MPSAGVSRSQPKENGSRWVRQSCRSPGSVHSSDSPGSQLQLDLQITRGRRETCHSAVTVSSAGAPQSQRQCNLILSGTICSERLRRQSKRRSTQCACQPLENVVTQTTITCRRKGHFTSDINTGNLHFPPDINVDRSRRGKMCVQHRD